MSRKDVLPGLHRDKLRGICPPGVNPGQATWELRDKLGIGKDADSCLCEEQRDEAVPRNTRLPRRLSAARDDINFVIAPQWELRDRL